MCDGGTGDIPSVLAAMSTPAMFGPAAVTPFAYSAEEKP